VECALSTIAANIWRGVPFVAITLLAGLQTISPSLYEAGAIDGATAGSASGTSPCRCSRPSSRW
jgi:ABC-type sugar transport system permease subunit